MLPASPLESGKPLAETLNYVPLAQTLVQQVEMYWQQSLGPAIMTASAGGSQRGPSASP